MLRLKPSNVVPPDGLTYKFQDGNVIRANDRDDWFAKIKKYASDNDYEVPSHEVCEDQLCRRLSGEFCIGGGPHSFINTRFTLDDFFRGAKVVISGTIVSKELAEERARICSMCVANVPVQGCGACTGVANLVASLKGAKSTKYDYLLKACAVCFCPNESQVWYAVEDLAKSVAPQMMDTYSEIEGCWKYREIVDFQAETA